MTEDDLRRKIEDLEKEIKYCDEDIYWAEESRKGHIYDAERYGEKAANGGGIISAEGMRGFEELHYSNAESDLQRIKDLERQKEKLTRQLEDYRYRLAKAVSSNSEGMAYEQKSYATTRRSNNGQTVKDRYLTFRKKSSFLGVYKPHLKDAFMIVVPYTVIVAVIWVVSVIMHLGLLYGLTAPFIAPIFLMVAAKRKLYWWAKKRPLRNLVVYILGFGMIFPTLFHISTGSVITLILFSIAVGIALGQIADLARMGKL